MPYSAPFPVPTMIAVGVAKPKAQGQAIISTATKASMAKVKFGLGPKRNQTEKVTTAAPNTAGTNIPATRSASPWMGAFEPVSYTHLRAHETDSYLVCR